MFQNSQAFVKACELFGDEFVFHEKNNISYGSDNGDGYTSDEVIVLGSL